MKCLSVMQPWARLLFEDKDCENRTWATDHRGPLLIQATQRFDIAGWKHLLGQRLVRDYEIEKYRADRGRVLGCVDIVDCTKARPTSHRWHEPGQYGLYRGPDPILFPPELRMALKGRRGGLFEVQLTEEMKGYIMGRKKKSETSPTPPGKGAEKSRYEIAEDILRDQKDAPAGTPPVPAGDAPVDGVYRPLIDWSGPGIVRRAVTRKCLRPLTYDELRQHIDIFADAARRKGRLEIDLANEKKRLSGEIAEEEKVMNEALGFMERKETLDDVACREEIDPVTRRGRYLRLDTDPETVESEFQARDAQLQGDLLDSGDVTPTPGQRWKAAVSGLEYLVVGSGGLYYAVSSVAGLYEPVPGLAKRVTADEAQADLDAVAHEQEWVPVAGDLPMTGPELCPGPWFWDGENRLLRVYAVAGRFKTGYERDGDIFWLDIAPLPDRETLDAAVEDLIRHIDSCLNEAVDYARYIIAPGVFVQVEAVDGGFRALLTGRTPDDPEVLVGSRLETRVLAIDAQVDLNAWATSEDQGLASCHCHAYPVAERPCPSCRDLVAFAQYQIGDHVAYRYMVVRIRGRYTLGYQFSGKHFLSELHRTPRRKDVHAAIADVLEYAAARQWIWVGGEGEPGEVCLEDGLPDVKIAALPEASDIWEV